MADEKDAKLATALRQAKQNPMFFAFVAKGANDGVLMVAKKKIPAKDVNDAKAESGGKKVFRGRCQGEDGVLVFEVGVEPPGTLAKQLKTVIHQSAGMMLKVDTRFASDLGEENESAGEEGEGGDTPTSTQPPPAPPPPAPPPPPQQQSANAALIKRLNALSAQIKTALAGPNKAQVATLFAQVNTQLQSGTPAQAEQSLNALEVALKNAPPPQPTQPSTADAIQRLNALSADIKQAMAGPNKQRVQALFVAVNGQIKNGDGPKADATLDELEELLKTPAPQQQPISNDAAALQAEWERRIIALEPRVLEAQKKRAGEAKWMTLFMSAQDMGGEGDFTKAIGVLQRIEAMLNAAPDSSASPALNAALAQWTQARTGVVATLKKLEGGIRSMNDRDGDAAIVLVQAIQANLTARPDTAQSVASLERYITTDDIIAVAEGPNGFNLDVKIRAPLLPALASIRAALPAV